MGRDIITILVLRKKLCITTQTPTRQDASEPATGAVARRGAVARGRDRGRGRTSSRGRGQAPGPSSTRVVTPPPTEEVVREGEEGENEQVQDEELPPEPTPKMINQVLDYLSGLSDQGQTPPVFSSTSTSGSGSTTCSCCGSLHGCLIGNRQVS